MEIELNEESMIVCLAICALIAFLFMLAAMRGCQETEARENIAAMTNGLVQTIPPGSSLPIWVKPEAKEVVEE